MVSLWPTVDILVVSKIKLGICFRFPHGKIET